MTWGEIQSVIQLAVALNAIYLALRDIRNPYVRSEEKAITKLLSTITERIGKATEQAEKDELGKISASLTDIYATFAGELYAFDRKDSWVGKACVGTVFIYIILLIVSSFLFNTDVNYVFALIICVIGFLPITIGFGFNVSIVRTIQRDVRQQRLDIEPQLIPKE